MDRINRVATAEIVELQCPCCGEWQEIVVEADLEGHLVQDCEVCCRPWQLSVGRWPDGSPAVRVESAG